MRRKSRELAVQALYALDLNPEPIAGFLERFWQMHPCRNDVRDYAASLIRGTMDRKADIDTMIAAHSSNWKIERMAVTDRNILRLGTFELMNEPSVPARVVINEAIEIAKKYGATDSATFINGVLDSIHHKLDEKSAQQVS